MKDVSIVKCNVYTQEVVHEKLTEAIDAVGGFELFKEGMTVAVKCNLVSGAKPEKAVTTHPMLISEFVKILLQKGVKKVIVGDSPGGLYTSAFVNRIYKVSDMGMIEEAGGVLNQNFEEKETSYPEAEVLKTFKYTAWLDEADVIVDFCKLKTHGMMGMSAAAKNMFGTIPGVVKPEYHFRFPDYEKFASMIVDLDEYFKPVLSIVDAVVGMEGNGPTMGTPREIGCIIASRSPHKADLVCASIIDVKTENLPILSCAIRRGLCPKTVDELDLYGDYKPFVVEDYENIDHPDSVLFVSNSNNPFNKVVLFFANKFLKSKPKLDSAACVGCGVCANICPAKAITIVDKKAQIDRSKCICCFCCQEFCPKGAMKVKRPKIASILDKK